MKTLIFFLVLGFTLFARSEDSHPLLSRQLLHNTVRIEALKNDGKVAIGTGFFYSFRDPKTTSTIPVLVSCWHVVSDCSSGILHFALGSSNKITRTQDHFTTTVQNFTAGWIRHPETNVDLAVMPLAEVRRAFAKDGKKIDQISSDDSLIASQSDLEKIGAFQDVKFIGYPIGIWDQKNNLPIIRRGITATDPSIDYDGRREFLIDAAVFPGSSGSPVYIAEENVLTLGPRIRLLGILYAVKVYNSQGSVEIVTIPSAFDTRVTTAIPANLGIVIKSDCLRDFYSVFGLAVPAVTTSKITNKRP